VSDWLQPAHLLALLLSLFRNAAVILALAGLGFAVGAAAARRLSWEGASEQAVLATGLGLALLGHLLFGLAMLGLFATVPIAITLGGAALLSLRGWRELARLLRAAGLRRLRNGVFRGTSALAAILLSPMLLLPLYPPTAFDATMYHLPYARAFLATGGAPFVAALRFPVFPQWTEILFALAIRVGGDLAAQSIQTLFTCLTAALLFLWGRRAFSAAAGTIAGALYLGSPLVTYFSGVAYVEPGLVFFSVAALYALSRHRAAGETRWLAASGLFAATAAATKYLGLFWVAFLLSAVVALRLPIRRRVASATLAAVFLLFLFPWYARIAAHTGSPVFPYLPAVFGKSAWDLGAHQPGLADGPSFGRFAAALRLPWDLVFARERFGWHPPVSPFYLPGVLLAVVAVLRDGRALRYGAAAAAYALFASLAPPDPRYLMPALALGALPIGAGAAALLRRAREPARRFGTVALVFLVVAPGPLYALRHAWRQGPVPATAEERQRYLSRFLPAYGALRHLNTTHGGAYTVYAFYAENMPDFAEGGFWGDWFGPGSYDRVLADGATAAGLHRALRGLGATHLLVLRSPAPPLPRTDPEFAALFRPEYADARAEVFALPKAVTARSSRTTSGPS